MSGLQFAHFFHAFLSIDRNIVLYQFDINKLYNNIIYSLKNNDVEVFQFSMNMIKKGYFVL
jgi:hypothetical protein